MPTVTVLPVGLAVEVGETEAVMRAAERAGLWWPTVCGGDAECGTCWVLVEEGTEHCSEMSETERARLALGMKAHDPRARLGCQLRVSGPVTVSRRSVRPGTRPEREKPGLSGPERKPGLSGQERKPGLSGQERKRGQA